jgi:FMN phosphatase YigB (HAD superfamily)
MLNKILPFGHIGAIHCFHDRDIDRAGVPRGSARLGADPVRRPLLIVDLDGTVYRSDEPVRRYAQLIADTLPTAHGQSYLAALDLYLESGPAAAAASEDTVEAAALREAVDGWGAAFNLATRCHGATTDATESAFAHCRAWMASPECPVQPVQRLLRTLAELRPAAEIVLVTNSPAIGMAGFLSRLGIAGCFDEVVAGARKPDGLRRLLQRRLGADLRQRPWLAFSVGDHYRNDIEPAAEIGAGCGYIDRYGRHDGPATATAPVVEGLLPVLRAWAADPAGVTGGNHDFAGRIG